MKKRFALLLVLVLCCLALPALADNVCKFDKTVTTLFEGDTLQTVLLLEGDPAEGTVTYSSNAEKRAVVDDHGVVSGIAKGNVTITATVKTEKKTYKATIDATPFAEWKTTVDAIKKEIKDNELINSLLDAEENENSIASIYGAWYDENYPAG